MTHSLSQNAIRRLILSAGLLLAAYAADALADTVTWTEPLGGAWEDGVNWDSGAVPTDGDFVYAPLNVSISSTGAGNQAYEFFNSSVLGVTAGQLGVVGTLTNDGSVTVSTGGHIQAGRVENDSGGDLTVTGTGSDLAVNQGIYNYNGTMTAADGASISAESIDNQQSFTASGGAQIGANSLVNWTGAQFNVENAGSHMDIQGAVTNDGAVDVKDNGLLTAHSIDNTDSLTVQSGGGLQLESMINHASGNVSITGGGTSATISGGDTTNHGTITTDAGASLQVDALDNEGSLSAHGGSTLAAGSVNNHAGGTIDVSGSGSSLTATSVVENASTIDVQAGGTLATGGFHQQSGLTRINGGALMSPNDLTFDGGTLEVAGTLSANKVWVNSGATISPGIGTGNAGTATVAGDLLLQGTSLFEIGGLGQFDLISATGAASLGGTLDVQLFNGFTPGIGDSFDILLASSVGGTFDNLILPVFNGLTFSVFVQPTLVRLTAAPVPLPAAVWLLLSGFLGVFFIGRPRKAVRGRGTPRP